VKRALLAAALVLPAAGCVHTEVRVPAPAAGAPAPALLTPVSAVEFKDASGGVSSEGTGILLKKPFFDTFREAFLAQFAALKVPVTPDHGSPLEVKLKQVRLTRGPGLIADLSTRVTYELRVRRDGAPDCVREVAGWATVRESLVSSPAGEALTLGLTHSLEKLGPALASSCLTAPGAGETAASASSDLQAWALAIGVGRARGETAPSTASAAADAHAVAGFAGTVLHAPEGQTVTLVDEMATLADLRKSVEGWLPGRAGPGSRVLVAVFGREGGTPGSLLPYDGDPQYPALAMYPLSGLFSTLGRLPARAVVILGPGLTAPKGRLPDNLKLVVADKDLKSALDAAKDAWGGP
jgi:hypothetical protein